MIIDPKRFYSIKEVITKNGGILPISSTAVYNAVKQGKIPSKEIFGRICIPGGYLQALADEASSYTA